MSAVLLFVLSLGYLGAEVYFNMRLLDVAGSVTSPTADIESVQVFGRSVSGFGCALLVLGLFAGGLFRLHRLRDKVIFAVIAVLSIVPLGMIVFGRDYHATPDEIFLASLPLAGAALVLLSRARYRVYVIAAVFCMTWPAAFLGQKLLIEETLVARTGAAERVNARYVLMLRAGFENCSMLLDDLELCDAEGQQDLVKSARIIMGALWTLYPQGIREDMIANKDKMVLTIALRDHDLKNPPGYDAYVARVAAERDKITQKMDDKLYHPYLAASETYIDAADIDKIRAESATAADRIDKVIDEGWEKYASGVAVYHRQLSSAVLRATQEASRAQARLRDICAMRKCPAIADKLQRINPEQVAAKMREAAVQKFREKSGGYPPDITSRAAFAAYGLTNERIRNAVEEHIRKKPGMEGFVLPHNWQYHRDDFRWMYESMFMQEVRRKWQEKFGDHIRPGLSRDRFYEAIRMPLPPALDAILMPPEKFFNDYILIRYKAEATRKLDEISAEEPFYADGEKLAEQGRDYVRAVYIPALALVISLIVVMVTVLRWTVTLTMMALRATVLAHASRGMVRAVRGLVLAAVTLLLVYMPYGFPHTYAAGGGYQRYLTGARESYPAIAAVLDWAIHAQPLIYRTGALIFGA